VIVIILVCLLKVLSRIHLHFLTHKLLFALLFFLHDWIGSTVDTLSVVMLV
jgi:hypothetical protein